jgi:hypothetical protein
MGVIGLRGGGILKQTILESLAGFAGKRCLWKGLVTCDGCLEETDLPLITAAECAED